MYSMTMDAIYEEHGSDGSHQFSVVGQLDGCSVTRPFLSVKDMACETRSVGFSPLYRQCGHTLWKRKGLVTLQPNNITKYTSSK